MSISRREIISGAGAFSFIGSSDLSGDPAAESCGAWLARHAEHARLGFRWQQIEDRLFRQYNWSGLTRAQRNRFAEKHDMDVLDDRMDALHEENLALLASLPAIVATTRQGICGKLAVAALEVCPEDHPEAQKLIKSILRDYRALHGG